MIPGFDPDPDEPWWSKLGRWMEELFVPALFVALLLGLAFLPQIMEALRRMS